MSVTGDQSVTDGLSGVVGEPNADAGEPSTEAGEPSADDQSIADDDMTTADVRHRAVTGAVVDTLRAIGLRLVGVVGTLVTARLLSPYDFGLVAVGTTVLAFGDFLSDGGVAVALIRRPEAPTKSELRALAAFQLGLDLLLVAVVGLVMLPFGTLGQVTTVIVASLPLGALRAAAYIIYERRLNYRPMAVVEVVETTVYYVWAIVTIILGWGVWGLATAFLVRETVGALLVLALLPEGRLLPVPSWKKVRPLLGFGWRFQAVAFVHMLRDQGVNLAVAAFGGVAMLGLWNVAWRIIQIPISLLSALWRVSYPGMARLVAANEDVGSTIERVIALVAIGTGVLVVPLAASSSAWVEVLIGAKWESAASAIPPACFAMMYGVPISVALAGYLWAIGNVSVPLRATVLGIPAAALLMLPLLPVIGVIAAGVGYIGAAFVESLFFVHAARQTASFKIGARLAIPIVLATVSATCGWFVARAVGPDLAGGLASSAVAFGVFVGGLALVHRADLVDALALVTRGLRGIFAAPAT